jgi:hypothetical protein
VAGEIHDAPAHFDLQAISGVSRTNIWKPKFLDEIQKDGKEELR